MRRAIACVLILVVASLAGCSCATAHEIEDAAAAPDTGSISMRDAATDPDAAHELDAFAPDQHYFTLEPASVDVIVTPERCAENEGATAILRVTTHFYSSCDSPGPIDVVLDPSARTITITPHLWLEHGRTDCVAVGAAYVRDVSVVGLTAGIWSVTSGGTATTYSVGAAPAITCPSPGLGTITRGSVCEADCECSPGLSCLAVRGDAACTRLCADPCETLGVGRDLSLSCASGDDCTSDPNLGWTCATSAIDECGDASPCPAGMTCPAVTEGPRQCAWAITLDGAIRHPCTTESDCDPGLDCVQRVDGHRACEVRCTTSDMACPSATPHACMAGNWVCEWLGE